MIVTNRTAGVRALRSKRCYRVIEAALRACERPGFRVLDYSVQSNHLHLICEADDRIALSRGLQGLFIRIARGINRVLARRGSLFRDRYHARALRTPSEVRNALAYVLNNARKHLAQGGRRRPRDWHDPRSSAVFFYVASNESWLPAPRTWLLRVGWRRAGPVRMDEVPRTA